MNGAWRQMTAWFNHLTSYCEHGGTLAIASSLIREAVKFDGWTEDYLSWPPEHWKDRVKGVPSHDPDKNAYHIRYLAEVMEQTGGWIGRELEARSSGYLIEGHHRLRAAKFLYEEKSTIIAPPQTVNVYLAHPSRVRFRVETVHLAEAKNTLKELESLVGSKRLKLWEKIQGQFCSGDTPLKLLELIESGQR